MIQKTLLLSTLSSMILQASLLDFKELEKAKIAYQEGNYSQAIHAYQAVEQMSDELLYDRANSYYQEGNYTQAQALYSQVQKPELAFKKWHNLGNSYAQLGKFDEGIKAYEEALKIQEDEDTKFNLELLKKKKKEQEQQKKQDQKDQNKKDNKDQKKEDQKDQENKKSKDQNDKKSDKEKKDQEKKKNEEQKKKEEKENKKSKEKEKSDEERKKEQAQAMQQAKPQPISDKEMRKYQKILDQRGINTLMLPITNKGDKNDETKPW